MSEPGGKSRRFERQIRFLRNRLSPEGALGLHLTIGVCVMLLGGWCFSELAENLGATTQQVLLDQRVTNWFREHAQPALTSLAWLVTFCGSVGFVTALSICCAAFFLFRGGLNRLVALATTMLGGSLLNILLKHFFHRQRPVLENPLVTLSSYGFPSGHTMGSTLLYGCLALIATRHSKKPWSRAAIYALAIVWISLIGLSRIYLGAHYLSDVVAAIAIGSAWLALCWTMVETFRRRKRRAD